MVFSSDHSCLTYTLGAVCWAIIFTCEHVGHFSRSSTWSEVFSSRVCAMPVLVVGGLKTFRSCCAAIFGYVSVLEILHHGFSLGAKSNMCSELEDVSRSLKHSTHVEVRRQLMGVSCVGSRELNLGGHTQLQAPLPTFFFWTVFFFFKNFLCVWVFCLHVYLCTTCIYDA